MEIKKCFVCEEPVFKHTENGCPDVSESSVDPLVIPVELGPKIFSFATFDKWVNGAQRIWRFHGVRGEDTICLDQKGRVCGWGKHFMTARDDNSFPIDVYLKRHDMQEDF
jgi:hypothetical protein